MVIPIYAVDFLHAIDYTMGTSKEELIMQIQFCKKCGEPLTASSEYASEYLGDNTLMYDEETGRRIMIGTLKCPNYREFLTFSNGHTYTYARRPTTNNRLTKEI